MTQRPLHVVNAGLELTDEPLPEVPELDLALSLSRIEALHGAAAGARYRHFLGRALAAQPGGDRDDLLTLATLAAWRAGAVAFRTDALRRLDAALATDTVRIPTLAAALGLPEHSVAAFAELQRGSRFGWPDLVAGGLVAVVGGFRGLFGPWLTPAVAVLAGDRPGTFLIRTAASRSGTAPAGADESTGSGDAWLLTVDVFGHTLTRLVPEETGSHPLAARWAEAGLSSSSPDEAGAPGATLQLAGYTAYLRLPEVAA
ncbi:hypothetical protein [Cryobacterium arcticum]|uniref:Uncharacterized protein n=1 Tax=Cryobacterium arcticum TaxID=670052 RepID=A0A318A041_9MICO|nr:hypothetical protein [Cryobacterium arcticum]PXA72261.1 hypothetical protein CTB96_05105 [Cryobacterium arcticum]